MVSLTVLTYRYRDADISSTVQCALYSSLPGHLFAGGVVLCLGGASVACEICVAYEKLLNSNAQNAYLARTAIGLCAKIDGSTQVVRSFNPHLAA